MYTHMYTCIYIYIYTNMYICIRICINNDTDTNISNDNDITKQSKQ